MSPASPAAQVPLASLMRQAADELRAQPVPPMRAAVLAAMPAAAAAVGADGRSQADGRWAPGRRRWSTGWPWSRRTAAHEGAAPRFGLPAIATAAAAFALLIVAGSVLLLLAPREGAGSGEDMRMSSSGFVPVAGQEQWLRLRDDGGTAWVVNTEMPRARLADYGLPFDPAHAADPVRAELLMRATGEVLAVRVLY